MDKIYFKMGREIGMSQGSTRFAFLPCADCGKERWVRWIVKQNRPMSLYCKSCRYKHRKLPVIIVTPLSHHKRSVAKLGERNPNYKKYGSLNNAWRGGRRKSDGYVRVWIHPDDFFYSMVDGNGAVAEHRLVMAKNLNRCLLPWEVVHHINGIRDDNSPCNLLGMPDRSHRRILQAKAKRIQELEAQVKGQTQLL